jgi:ABC-type uncharacterized transport system substrate-binding protein
MGKTATVFFRFATVLTGLALAPAMALAHPHVWADMRSQLLVSEQGLITGLRVQWTLDKTYAQDALDGMTHLPDGSYSKDDMAKLTAENLDALSSYGYFVNFRQNDQPQKIGKAQDGDQAFNPKDGRLTLLFTVPLETPLDPAKGAVTLKVYDPEFFIDFEYVQDKPLLISRTLPAGCRAQLLPAVGTAATDQTRLMLAGKGKDWKPGAGEDFGSLFAPTAEVKCGT